MFKLQKASINFCGDYDDCPVAIEICGVFEENMTYEMGIKLFASVHAVDISPCFYAFRMARTIPAENGGYIVFDEIPTSEVCFVC